jgi:hypothetical protein
MTFTGTPLVAGAPSAASRRVWRRAELAGRWLMLAFVVVCALGLLGRGPLSEHTPR